MLFGWKEQTPAVLVWLAYLLIGIGAGLALAPASRSLTSSVPVLRVGMASATTDLQRDLGGSVMQAGLGALLTAGYATAFLNQIDQSAAGQSVSESTEIALTASYSSAANLAEGYPQYSEQIIAAARESFLTGANVAYVAACVAAALGAILVAWRFPGRAGEQTMLDDYAAQDAAQPEPSGA
jgi:hypothetical protein